MFINIYFAVQLFDLRPSYHTYSFLKNAILFATHVVVQHFPPGLKARRW